MLFVHTKNIILRLAINLCLDISASLLYEFGKVVFVAGFTDQLGFREIENFFNGPIAFEKIKTKSLNGFVAIQSDNDPFVSEQYGERLKEELGAKLIIKHNGGHMSGEVDNEESCTQLPEVLANI